MARKTTEQKKALLLGQVYAAMKAREHFEMARAQLTAAIQERSGVPELHAKLGVALASLGRAEEAVREGRRAMEIVPEAIDALDGPMFTTTMAHIYATLGRTDDALPIIEHLLTIPGGMSARAFRAEPAWDRLRGDSRFETLLTKYETTS